MSKKFSPYQQAMRHNRMKYFEKCVLPFIYEYDVSAPNEHCFKVVDTPKGYLTIYPKGNTIAKWLLDIKRYCAMVAASKDYK